MEYYHVYVLKLQDGKFYIGISKDFKKRVKQHKDGKGAEFTKLYKPLSVVETRYTQLSSKIKAEHIENIVTIQWMMLKGIENVRGGDFCICDLDELLDHMGESLVDGIQNNRNMPKKKAYNKATELYNKTSFKSQRDKEISNRELGKNKYNRNAFCEVEMCWRNHGKKCDLGFTPYDKKNCEKNFKAR